VASLRRLLPVFLVLALCIGMAAPFASALPETGDEKSVTARMPADPAPAAASEEKEVTARPAPLVSEPPTLTEMATPINEETTAVTSAANETPAAEPVATVFFGTADTDDGADADTDDDADADTDGGADADTDDDAEEPMPTLEREAPPRPGATMAKSHQWHDRPLALSDHQLVSPIRPSLTPGANETVAPPAVVEPRDGLFVKGVGLILDQTPEDVALTRSGVEIANLEWLLDPAMRLAGRHPRAVFEGETFTVTVTIEARNLTATGTSPAYVVLVPPPGETGVYEITRTREPPSLRDGERGVWEFSVATRTGRLTVVNLTLPEERLVTNLTSNPDLFAFRAYALVGNQEVPSSGISDPVLSIRPDGDTGVAEASLPELYTLAGIEASDLRPSETMAGAWERGVGHETIVAGAVGHLEALRGLGKEEVAAFYAVEGGTGTEEPAASPSSPLDWLLQLFSGLFGS